MKTVAANDFYELAVDVSKNRMYMTLKGQWIKESDVSNWLDDLTSATGLMSPGWGCLVDSRNHGGMLLSDHFAAGQKMALDHKIGKVARVYTRESFAKLQIEEVGAGTGFNKYARVFATVEEAEAWLDQEG
ncbi:MAG: hypothetical protein V1792_07700 [Pseudomonadota bacterium]